MTAMLTLARAQRLAPPGSGVPSPCVGVCRMQATTGLCQGCWRTLEEIAGWSRADDAYKRAVWAEIERRQPAGDAP